MQTLNIFNRDFKSSNRFQCDDRNPFKEVAITSNYVSGPRIPWKNKAGPGKVCHILISCGNLAKNLIPKRDMSPEIKSTLSFERSYFFLPLKNPFKSPIIGSSQNIHGAFQDQDNGTIILLHTYQLFYKARSFFDSGIDLAWNF